MPSFVVINSNGNMLELARNGMLASSRVTFPFTNTTAGSLDLMDTVFPP